MAFGPGLLAKNSRNSSCRWLLAPGEASHPWIHTETLGLHHLPLWETADKPTEKPFEMGQGAAGAAWGSEPRQEFVMDAEEEEFLPHRPSLVEGAGEGSHNGIWGGG